jgi:hypothetical protein
VEGFKFDFTTEQAPLLTDVQGKVLVQCDGLLKMSQAAARFNTPKNVSDRESESLGALFYLLTAIKLAEDECLLFSDSYSAPGQLSPNGKQLWKQLEFLGLAYDLSDIKHYQFCIPDSEKIKNLHEQARNQAFAIYAENQIQLRVKDIQERLRLPSAGQTL